MIWSPPVDRGGFKNLRIDFRYSSHWFYPALTFVNGYGFCDGAAGVRGPIFVGVRPSGLSGTTIDACSSNSIGVRISSGATASSSCGNLHRPPPMRFRSSSFSTSIPIPTKIAAIVSRVKFPGYESHLVICSGFFPILRASSRLVRPFFSASPNLESMAWWNRLHKLAPKYASLPSGIGSPRIISRRKSCIAEEVMNATTAQWWMRWKQT